MKIEFRAKNLSGLEMSIPALGGDLRVKARLLAGQLLDDGQHELNAPKDNPIWGGVFFKEKLMELLNQLK